ncbi:MAG: heteromeric transposase endonuclease subunit TnsA [Epulopiscium sp.]|nr:heteromeric transposase endonuclease subunit TnsA [Candidatus Epulonipiscium sp.]
MAKRNLDWTEEKYQRFLKEGRGQGEGKEYKPWLTIQDFPSQGRVSRVFGLKSKRIHHFFSDNETRYFYLLEWNDRVVDIREHFPLLDIEKIIKDKDDLNLGKFVDKKSGTPYVFTTTFLTTLRDIKGKYTYIARSIKASSELEKKQVIERLEIERRYWESKNIDWGLVTQKDIPVVKAKNIEWIHSAFEDEENRGIGVEEKEHLSSLLMEKLRDSVNPIRRITSSFDKELNLESGTGLFLFKYLIGSRQIKVNMDEKIDVNKPANQCLEIIDIERGEEHETVIDC